MELKAIPNCMVRLCLKDPPKTIMLYPFYRWGKWKFTGAYHSDVSLASLTFNQTILSTTAVGHRATHHIYSPWRGSKVTPLPLSLLSCEDACSLASELDRTLSFSPWVMTHHEPTGFMLEGRNVKKTSHECIWSRAGSCHWITCYKA